MRKAFRFFMPVLCIVSCLAGRSLAQVVINEFCADPARDWDGDAAYSYRDDEWVEIANIGSVAVDLTGYLLSDGEGTAACRYGFAGLLEPGGLLVVYGSDSRAWEESNGYPVYGLSLNNDGDSVRLYRVEGADTVMIDEFQYNDRSAEDDRSVGRDPRSPMDWYIFDALNPCSDSCEPPGCGCEPTPGSSNDCSTATRSESWGMIKSLFRD